MNNSATLAFEIGTEEIPAFDLSAATKQLETLVPKLFDAQRIVCADVKVFSSPRRLIVLVEGVPAQTEALTESHKGPSAKIAFDDEGNPTKAAEGFARGKGLGVENLERREIDGVEYVFAETTIESQPVASLLPQVLESLIESISWPKSMKWNTRSELFSRPVRWLLALLDDRVIPVSYAGLEAGNLTYGHRFLAPGTHEVKSASSLLTVLNDAFVIPSQEAREHLIRDGIAVIEKQTNTRVELPEKTLTEVINLTEYPTPIVGVFDQEFLKVPEEIIVDAMLVHQRYFPLYDQEGKLVNKFVAVSNGDPAHSDIIIDGNERVVRPRLSDAKFFYEEDLKRPLESYVERLDEVVFQETLGTMKAKTERIVTLADELAADANLSAEEAKQTHRAAYLCKADLVTNAVVEFTSVQGIMGSYYARAAGESDQVSEAIAQHYRPRFANDDSPSTVVGRLVAYADKLDTICGLFSIGQAPTGSSDPFALRRNAIGIIKMLDEGLPISLMKAIRVSLDTFSHDGYDSELVCNEITEFFLTRTKVILRDRGFSGDVIDAVLAGGVTEPAEIISRTQALSQAREDMREVMDDLATAYARANNLRDESLSISVDESLMGDSEQILYQAINHASKQVEQSLSRDDYAQALRDLAKLRTPIDSFFEEIMVMDENPTIKDNRLKLLNCFVAVFGQVADFGKMAKTGK
ncbi:MAG: glycine--tRNA ligase subunit beta [Raoultibacter sp.]|jgi:glycyl-tRNA synthetase beta chain